MIVALPAETVSEQPLQFFGDWLQLALIKVGTSCSADLGVAYATGLSADLGTNSLAQATARGPLGATLVRSEWVRNAGDKRHLKECHPTMSE